MKMNDWVAICAVEDIPRLGSRRVARPEGVPGAPVALFRTATGEVHALLDRCPHKGGPLSQGIVMDHGVACPLHNWTIRFADGQAQAPDEGQTPAFAVRVEDGRVHLDAAQLATQGTDLALPVAGPCGRRC